MRTWNEIFPHWGHQIRLPKSLSPFLSSSPMDNSEVQYAEWVEAQPKYELHVHMEAAVSESFYENLNVQRQLYNSENMPARRAPFRHLKDFINAWMDNTKLIEEESAYFNLARDFVRLRSLHNITYSEVHVSPVDFSHMRRRFGFAPPLSFRSCLLEILKGLKSAEGDWSDVKVRLIIDVLWIATEEEHAAMLADIEFCIQTEMNRDGKGLPFIVGVGLGGLEVAANAERICNFLSQCRKLDLKVDIHSGENVSEKEHRHSLEILKPNRIGHGISGASSEFFFQGHISTNPLSNVLTGSFQNNFSLHPIAQLYKADRNFSVNSDDPLLFGTTLTLEYVALRRAFGWEKEFFHHTQKMARQAVLNSSY